MPLSATLALIIQDKSNHLYQHLSTKRHKPTQDDGRCYLTGRPLIEDNKMAQMEHFNKIGKVI